MNTGLSIEKNKRKIVIYSKDKLQCARCCPHMRVAGMTRNLACFLSSQGGEVVGEVFRELKRTSGCLEEFSG